MPIRTLLAICLLTACVTGGWDGPRADAQDVSSRDDPPPPDAIRAYEAAQRLMDEKKYDDVLGQLNRAIRSSEKGDFQVAFPDAYLLRGQVYAKRKQWSRAVDSFNKAIQDEELMDDQQTAEAHNGRGEVYLEAGDAATALSDFTTAAEIEWINKEYLVNQGKALARVGAADSAIEVLDRAIQIDDQVAEAYAARGLAHGLLAREKPEELQLASADFSKAIELDPDNKELYYDAGTMMLGNEKLVESIHLFTMALAKDQAEQEARNATAGDAPDSPDGQVDETADEDEDEDEGPYVQPLLARALAFIQLGKRADQDEEVRTDAYQRAVADMDHLLMLLPTAPDALLTRGIAERLLGQYDASIASLTEALQLNPEMGEALYRRGIVWFLRGEDGMAIEDLTEASQVAPDDVRPYMWQGFTYARQGEYYKAINAYALAIEKDASLDAAYDNRGRAYLHVGQIDKAIDDFDQVIRLTPNDADAYFKRGIAYGMNGDDARARDSYQEAVRIDPDNAAAYERLAGIHERLGDQDAARDVRVQREQAEQRAEQQAEQPPTAGPAAGPHAPDSAEPLPDDSGLDESLFPPAGTGDLFSPTEPGAGSGVDAAIPALPPDTVRPEGDPDDGDGISQPPLIPDSAPAETDLFPEFDFGPETSSEGGP